MLPEHPRWIEAAPMEEPRMKGKAVGKGYGPPQGREGAPPYYI